MNMNKKIGLTLGVLVIAGVGFIASFWYFGNQAKQQITNIIANIKQDSAKWQDFKKFKLEIKQIAYEQGIFSSYAKYEFIITANFREEISKTFVVEGDIKHGPIISDQGMAFKLAKMNLRLAETADVASWFEQNNNQMPMQVQLDLDFAGGFNSHMQVLPFEYVKKNYEYPDETYEGSDEIYKVSWGKVEANFVSSKTSKVLDFNIGDLLWRNERFSFALNGIKSSSTTKIKDEANYDTTGDSTILRADVSLLDKTRNIEYHNLTSNVQLNVKQNILSYITNTKLSNIKVKNTNSDVAFDVGSLEGAFGLDNIDLNVINKFFDAVEKNPQNVMVEGVSLFQELIKAKPKLTIGQIVWTDELQNSSDIFASASLHADGDLPLDTMQFSAKLLTPMFEEFANKFYVILEGFSEEEATEIGIQTSIDMESYLVNKTRLFIKNGLSLISNINYANGRFTINNEETTLDEFLQRSENIL